MMTDGWRFITGQAQEPEFVAELYMWDGYGSGFTIGLVRKLTKRQQRMWKKWFGLDYKERKHTERMTSVFSATADVRENVKG